MSGQINNQVDLIIQQARAFLTDAGEFYPFGAVVKPDGALTPIGVYLENDNPTSIEVLEILQKSLLQRLKLKEVVSGAICLDVLYTPAGSENASDALKIMTLSVEGHSQDYFVPYRNENGQYVFDEIISEPGTLKLE